MSSARAGTRLLTLAVCAMLAACAAEPVKPPPKPAVVIAHPEPPPTTLAPIAPATAKDEPWASLTASFVMHDCADSPLIRANARMYTRSPAHFEQRLKNALPLMMYVQKQLQAAGIPGEFVMLPMLESSYQPVEPSRHGDPGGMWQMMPATGRHHGLARSHAYDGLRDPVASTRAAINMLKKLDRQFGDWRLVDMAYNAGPYAVVNALRKHPDLGDGPIPDIPLSHTTRTHLARLMALSCILRDPQRFHVDLPAPSPTDELQTVEVPADTSLRNAADMAEIPESELRALNPGYRGEHLPDGSPRTLLLPAGAAQSLADALTVNGSESVAQVDTHEANGGPSDRLPLPAEPAPANEESLAPTTSAAASRDKRHRVREGETLWSIAHQYHVSVADLKRWNDLHDDMLQPGETLRVKG
jgi:membrane-bound lytic murein transglycosylase D